jgi:DNA-directed RNA polymerase subunit M/transcription elongation factor TFIIS
MNDQLVAREQKKSIVHREKCLNLITELITTKIPEKFDITFNHENVIASKIEKSINKAMIKELDTVIPAKGEDKIALSWDNKKVQSCYNRLFLKVYSNMYLNDNSIFVLKSIKDRTLHPSKIVSTEHQFLLSPTEQERQLIRVQKDIDRRGVFPYKPEVVGGLFKCKRCKSTKTSSTQFQTRSADEPMTVFVRCHNCENRWRC